MPVPRLLGRWRWNFRRGCWENQKVMVDIALTPETRLRCWLWYHDWLNRDADRPVTSVT